MRSVLLLAGAASVLALACTASTGNDDSETSQSAISRVPPVRVLTSPYLTIDGIEMPTSGSAVEDHVPVENRPFYVHFTVVNAGKTPLTGYVGGETIPVSLGLPVLWSNMSYDWMVQNLAPGATQSGVIALTAARAELNTGVELFFYNAPVLAGEFYTQGPPVFSANTRTDVAARYEASISSINIHRTRSPQTDTDYVALTAAYAGEEAGDAPGGLMPMANLWRDPQMPAVRIGDVQDGLHDLGGFGITTLPFDSVPGKSPSPELSFTILNDGSTAADDVKTVLDDISSITQVVLSGIYPGSASAWAAGNQATQGINSLLTDCNGVAAVYDIPGIPSTDLEVETRTSPATQVVGLDGDKLGPPYNSPVVCGMAAYYDVAWTYRRMTDPADTMFFSPATIRARPGQTLKLSIDRPTAGIEWTLEGNFRSSMIGQDGTLHLDPNVTAADGVTIVARSGAATARAWVDVVTPTIVRVGPIVGGTFNGK